MESFLLLVVSVIAAAVVALTVGGALLDLATRVSLVLGGAA